jgi:hypothetical protein
MFYEEVIALKKRVIDFCGRLTYKKRFETTSFLYYFGRENPPRIFPAEAIICSSFIKSSGIKATVLKFKI